MGADMTHWPCIHWAWLIPSVFLSAAFGGAGDGDMCGGGKEEYLMHVKYLWYIIKHKWFVFVEACKLGIPWLGLVHDWSKVLPDEWIPYARYFYGPKADQQRDPVGYFYKRLYNGESAFDLAWLKHIHRNKHHWQWWVLREDDGGTKSLAMPNQYRREMLADWRGAGRAQGYGDNTLEWYMKNKDKMQLNPETRQWIERALCVVAGRGDGHSGS